MKWLRTLIIFERGDVISSADWQSIHDSYIRTIRSIDFPAGSGKLKLRRKVKRPDGQWNRNGVSYLAKRFMDHMVEIERCRAEVKFDVGQQNKIGPEIQLYPSRESYREPITSDFGDFDFVIVGKGGSHVVIESETGNISSSHRTMNKMAIALEMGKVQACVLIVPSRNLYEHLTDRVGNISELSGYISMWKTFEARVQRGLLAITVVEHDELTDDRQFPYLRMGNAGRARQGRAKRSPTQGASGLYRRKPR